MPVAEPEVFDLSECECCDPAEPCECCPGGTPKFVNARLPSTGRVLTASPCEECDDYSEAEVVLEQVAENVCTWRWTLDSDCLTNFQLEALFSLTCDEENVTATFQMGDLFSGGNQSRTWQKVIPVEEFDCLNFDLNYTSGDIISTVVNGPACDPFGDTARVFS